MKTNFTWLALFIALSVSAQQQIPNGGFETWTVPGNPDNWGTWESATGAPLGLATRDTTTKVEGAASIKLKTDSVQAGPQKLLIPAIVTLGTAAYAPPNIDLRGIPFTSRPDTLLFSYKYAPAVGDTAWVEIQISGLSGDLLAGGVPLTSTNGQWVNVYIPMTADIAPGTVDSIRVLFSSSLPTGFGIQGSVMNVDDVRFGYVPTTAVNTITEMREIKLFPNPTASMINISMKESVEGFVTISDMTGKAVLETSMLGNNTKINVSHLQTGFYIYQVTDNSGNILKRDRFNVTR